MTMPRKNESPLSKMSRTENEDEEAFDEPMALAPAQPPQGMIVHAEKVVEPGIVNPIGQVKDIVGPNNAANINIQEQTTLEGDKVTNTRTFSIEMPARRMLPDVTLPTLGLILGITAIVGTVLIFLF